MKSPRCFQIAEDWKKCRLCQRACLIPMPRRISLRWPQNLLPEAGNRKQNTDLMFAKIQRVHFVGIGGIGMSGIAEVLLNMGFAVSGSDLKASPVTDRLEKLGATIYLGHRAE